MVCRLPSGVGWGRGVRKTQGGAGVFMKKMAIENMKEGVLAFHHCGGFPRQLQGGNHKGNHI